jgi:hypothetical protein
MDKKSRFSIKVSESFEETIILKALEMVKEGKTEGEVDNKHFWTLRHLYRPQTRLDNANLRRHRTQQPRTARKDHLHRWKPPRNG